jgi:hypothetical protein
VYTIGVNNNRQQENTRDDIIFRRSTAMVYRLWQTYYTIELLVCQHLLFTNLKKEVINVREEREKIRAMLYRNTLTNTWLINRLEEKGINTEKSELSSVLRGVRKGAKAESIIRTSVEILGNYETKMGVTL